MHALYNSEATEPEAMEEVIKRGDQNGKKIFSYNIKFNVISDDYNKTLYNIEDIDTVVKYLNSITPFIMKMIIS